jgi:hypothetical protein
MQITHGLLRLQNSKTAPVGRRLHPGRMTLWGFYRQLEQKPLAISLTNFA